MLRCRMRGRRIDCACPTVGLMARDTSWYLPKPVVVAVRAYAQETNLVKTISLAGQGQKKAAAPLRRLRGASKGSWTPSRMECTSQPSAS